MDEQSRMDEEAENARQRELYCCSVCNAPKSLGTCLRKGCEKHNPVIARFAGVLPSMSTESARVVTEALTSLYPDEFRP